MGGLSDGQQHGMFIVFRADTIEDVPGQENMFLAQQFLSLLVPAIGAENFSRIAWTQFFELGPQNGLEFRTGPA
jgi:hypothetical protein